MSKNRLPPAIAPGTADVGTAVLSGDAFYRLAQEFISHAAPDFQTAHQRAAANMGELIASATNLSLSIEIYLKALLLHNAVAAPKSHELPDLFAKLPSTVRSQVEQAYERLRAPEKEGVTASFAIHVARNAVPRPPFGQVPKQEDHSLRAVLQRSANAFVTWRYLFAHGTTIPGAPLMYEFLRLSFAARAVRLQFGAARVSTS